MKLVIQLVMEIVIIILLIMLVSIGKIRAMKPLRSFETGAWLNDFIFLE